METLATEQQGRWARITEREPALGDRKPRGGFDGLYLTFGGDAGPDALLLVFGQLVDGGYVVTLTLDGGEALEVEPLRWAVSDDGTPTLVYRHFDQHAADCMFSRPFSEIIGLHIW